MARKPPFIELVHPITKQQFRDIVRAVRKAGYRAAIDWSENIEPPANAREFAGEAIYVICNSGMRNSVALGIFEKCMLALNNGESCKTVFGHPGKSSAIDHIWLNRVMLFRRYLKADDPIEFCSTLPWVGSITKYHLAKNFGANVAKPDVHLLRLANAGDTTAQELCERLALETGFRAATVDLILWRACADGIIHSR